MERLPTVGFPVSDWSVTRVYPHLLRLIGPSCEYSGHCVDAANLRVSQTRFAGAGEPEASRQSLVSPGFCV
eukprot:6672988-Pyramimonas_sp.AAC.1